MSAEDRLWELYQTPDTASAFGDALDDFAHELAEKQRAWAKETYDKDIYVDEMTYQRLREQADLIDPHPSAGPVRPGEEQP
jgi:hypothetical protein